MLNSKNAFIHKIVLTYFISNLLSESEEEYSSTSFVPSDLNDSSDENKSISETENDETQIVVDDTNNDAIDIAENVQSNVDSLKKVRKRIRDETKLKRNIRKNLRNAGKKCITVKGKEVPEKLFEDFQCMCQSKCHQLFSLEHRENVFRSYYAL